MQAGVADCVNQLDALLDHALWQVAVTPGHRGLAVAQHEAKLFVEVSSTPESVGHAMPEAVEAQAAPVLHADAGQILAEFATEVSDHLAPWVPLRSGEQSGLTRRMHLVMILDQAQPD